MLREIVLDTETTGLDAANGDRLIEVGCIEIVNRIPTGREYHRYLNPEREVHPDAVAVHGLTNEFLQDKPVEEPAFLRTGPKSIGLRAKMMSWLLGVKPQELAGLQSALSGVGKVTSKLKSLTAPKEEVETLARSVYE